MFLKGECTLSDVIVPIKKISCSFQERVVMRFEILWAVLFERFLEETKVLNDLDFMIIDTGAGIGEHIQLFLEAADEVIVVTVPDPAAHYWCICDH